MAWLNGEGPTQVLPIGIGSGQQAVAYPLHVLGGGKADAASLSNYGVRVFRDYLEGKNLKGEEVGRVPAFQYDEVLALVVLGRRTGETGAAVALVNKGNPARKRTQHGNREGLVAVRVIDGRIVLERIVLHRDPGS